MIWLVLLSAVTGLAACLWPDVTASLLIPTSLFACLLVWLRKTVPAEDRDYLTRVLIVAFALRLACAYLVEVLRLIEKHDALKYHVWGIAFSELFSAWRFEEVHAWTKISGHPGYYLLVGTLYALFGPNILLGQNLNVLASALTVLAVYYLGREVSPDPRVARLACLGFAWFPNSIFWSTQLLKDSLIVALEVMLSLELVRLINRPFRLATLLRLLLWTSLLAELRFYLPVMIFASCGCVYLAVAWRSRGGRPGTSLVFLAVLALTCVIGWQLTGSPLGPYLQAPNIAAFRASTMGGESDFGKQADLASPEGLLQFLPVGIAYFLAGPLPWEAQRLSQYLTWFDIPIWYPTLALGAIGMGTLLRRRQALPLFAICAGLTLFYSLLLANLGTAYRMRLQVTPFFLIAAANYWYRARPAAEPFAPPAALQPLWPAHPGWSNGAGPA